MKMAGIMVSHSLLQNGPGMPCLAPYVYEFIIWGDKEHTAAYVTFEDLPETSQTEVLMTFLKGVSGETFIYVVVKIFLWFESF